jgi:hypothetical protein
MRRQFVCWMALASVLLANGGARAQVRPTGSLRGVVTDQKRTPIDGAKVVVRNEGLGASYETTTNKDGTYSVMALPPGRYTVTVTTFGFRAFHSVKQTLTEGGILVVNAELDVGASEVAPQVAAPRSKDFFVVCGPELRLDVSVEEGFWYRIQKSSDATVETEYAKAQKEAKVWPDAYRKLHEPDDQSWSFEELYAKWNSHIRDRKKEAAAAFEVLNRRGITEPKDTDALCSFLLSDPPGSSRVSVDLSYVRAIPKVVEKAGRGAVSAVTEKSTGLVLGFLEASPAEELTLINKLPASKSIGRSFRSYLTGVPQSISGIYAIKLEPESLQGPRGSGFKLLSDAVQPILLAGKPNEPTWNFRFDANTEFGEATFSIKAYLLKFVDEVAWQARAPSETREISVPISRPRFKLDVAPEQKSKVTLEVWQVIVVPILVALIAAALPAVVKSWLVQQKKRRTELEAKSAPVPADVQEGPVPPSEKK